MPQPMADSLIDEIVARYAIEPSQKAVAEAIGVCRESVLKALRIRGVALKPWRVRKRVTLADRFWLRVDRRTPDECWPYMGAHCPRGYGRFSFERHSMPASRVAFFLANGRWAEITRHTCDNPPCVNPAHLIEGTQMDNVRDMIVRERMARGEQRGALLTESQVREIKARLGLCQNKQLAREFGVSVQSICDIKHGRRWKWI